MVTRTDLSTSEVFLIGGCKRVCLSERLALIAAYSRSSNG